MDIQAYPYLEQFYTVTPIKTATKPGDPAGAQESEADYSSALENDAYSLDISGQNGYNNTAFHLNFNLQINVSASQAYEQGLSEAESFLQRMREIAVKSATEDLTDQQRLDLQSEMDNLRAQLDSCLSTAQANAKKIISDAKTLTIKDSSPSLSIAAGSAGDVSYMNSSSSAMGGGSFYLQIGPNAGDGLAVQMTGINSYWLGLRDIDVTTQEGASKALETLDRAIKSVSNGRAELGAYINRLERIIENNNNMSANLAAAESRIRDLDYAKAIVEYAKYSLRSEICAKLLPIAIHQPEQVLFLLNNVGG